MSNPYGSYPGSGGPPGTGGYGQQPGMYGGHPGGQAPGGYPPTTGGGYPGAGGYPQPAGSYGHPQGGPGYGGPPPGVDPTVYQWFMAVDQDRTGHINMMELQQALTNANWSHFNAETCRLMINMFDRDHSGQIDLNEFQALWTYINQWKGVFDQFDRDRSGFIDANELHNAFNQMGYRVSQQFAGLVVYRYDPVAKQRLSLDNFIQASVMLKTVTDAFRQRDSQMRGSIQVSYEDFLSMVLLNKP